MPLTAFWLKQNKDLLIFKNCIYISFAAQYCIFSKMLFTHLSLNAPTWACEAFGANGQSSVTCLRASNRLVKARNCIQVFIFEGTFCYSIVYHSYYKLLTIKAPGPTSHDRHKSFPTGPLFLRLPLEYNMQREMINGRIASRLSFLTTSHFTSERNALLTPTGYGSTYTEFRKLFQSWYQFILQNTL